MSDGHPYREVKSGAALRLIQRQRCADRVAAGEFDWLLDAMESGLATDPTLTERAAAVAWLRERAKVCEAFGARWIHGGRGEVFATALREEADALERGEHVGEEPA
jgi:hypothetical protein